MCWYFYICLDIIYLINLVEIYVKIDVEICSNIVILIDIKFIMCIMIELFMFWLIKSGINFGEIVN